MAEGAHLTGTANLSPSIFEVVSQNNFSKALQPALRHLIKFLAQKDPDRFGPTFRNFNEIYLVFDSIIQLHYLSTKGGTLGESFYGLNRKPLNDTADKNFTLKRRFLLASLTTSVLLPYLRGRLKEKSLETPSRDSSNRNALINWFLRNYNLITGIFDTISVIYYILYAFGKIRTHSPLLHVLGLRLDYSREEIGKPSLIDSWRGVTFQTFPKLLFTSFGESILFALEIGSFFAQFLDWWYSSSERRALSVTALPIPKPYSNGLNMDRLKCPLCRQERKNPTALSTSGIVYCYSCINKYLKHDQKCPVTQIPSTSQHLIRIFE